MNDSQNQFDKRFLILGNNAKIKSYQRQKKIDKLLSNDEKAERKGIWGTLGWKNDKPFNYAISNSVSGNQESIKRDITTASIISELKSINTKIENVETDVLERYINLDAAEFDVDWNSIKTYDELPELRLDLFVEKTEGAMVYYYHQQKENFLKLNDDNVYEQFIQCQATEGHSTNRDRLTYFFKALPPFDYSLDTNGKIDWGIEERQSTFIIKIISFKRNQGTPGELLTEFFSNENLKTIVETKGGSISYTLFGEKKNRLLIYNNNEVSSPVDVGKKEEYNMAGAFYTVDETHKIDLSKKTLLLIHGTFSTTFKTFEGLIKLDEGSSQLKEFLDNNIYEQVIAFDHPTISADVFTNIKDLKKLLPVNAFEQSVSILAASRGCILAQAIGADKTLPFIVDKCLMFSPANGVGYFDAGDKLATGLGIMKDVTGSTQGKFIFALLQFSAKYFLDQPGAQQMTFNSAQLNKVIKLKPVNANSQYTAVINDWERQLVSKWLKRAGMVIADNIIKLMLGLMHDFVVGTKGQRNLPKAFEIDTKPMASTHCKYFNKGELQYRKGNAVVLSDFMRKYL